MAETPQASSLVRELEQQAASVLDAHEELRRAMANQQLDAALVIFARKVQPRLEEIGQGASALVDQQNGELTAASQGSASKAARLRSLTIGLMLLALSVGGAVLWIDLQANRTLPTLSVRM